MLAVLRKVDASILEPETKRSPGIHLSQVLKKVLVGWDPRRFKKGGGPPDPARLLQGFLLEEMIGKALARLAKKRALVEQFEITASMAGREIFCTLDAFDCDKWKVHEYKATWMSSRHPIKDTRFWHWFAQVKAYCKVADTRQAELWAFFVNGNYKDSGPELKVWDLEFSKQEIAENWLMLENCLRAMIRTGEIK